MPRFPPLDLFLEVTAADGRRFKWDGNQPDANRPKNLSFRSKLGEGFSDASLNLTRRIDLDYPDLSLLNDVTVVGADGSVAYEGRISQMPRETGEQFSVGVTLTEWMAHAADQKFTGVIVDRDHGSWGAMSSARKAALLTASWTPHDPESTTDPTDSSAQVSTVWTGGWASPFKPQAQAFYDAGAGNLVKVVSYSWKRTNTTSMNVPADTNWSWYVAVSSDDKMTAFDGSAELRAAGPSNLQTFTSPTARRFAVLTTAYNATGVAAEGTRWGVDWSKLAVYGDHGLTLRTGDPTEPPGVTASDVLRHLVSKYCPKLHPDGIRDTTYVIPHLTFRDPTTPYDAFLQLNKYHLWHLGVWEGRVVHFRPYDLSEYQWEIRTDDEGTTFQAQGPSVENLFNGINVTYTDLLTGKPNRLLAKDHAELRDESPMNDFNRHGIPHPDELQLSAPTLEAQALQIGRAILIQRNTPKTPGTMTVRGHIRDRVGNWQPVWKIRAGDLISVTNFPNDSPRLVHDALYNDDDKTVTLAIDAPADALDAYLDRLSVALQARGLS